MVGQPPPRAKAGSSRVVPTASMTGESGKKSALRTSRFGSAQNAGGSPKKPETAPPPVKPKGRLSLKLLSSIKGDSKKVDKDNSVNLDESYENIVEKDPVIELLEARTTQRVRFSLDSPEENTKTSDAAKPPTDKQSTSEREQPHGNGKSIKNFMRRNLFNKGGKTIDEELNDPELAEANKHSMLWKSAAEETSDFVHTSISTSKGSEVMVSFTENPKTRSEVVKLLNKGKRAQQRYYRYEYAVKCHVKALELLNEANYPNDHPTMIKTVNALNSAHHALSSYVNSANIVKIGIRCEDSGDLVRALKMYTIAYRIRRDNLSRSHPSLVVLLNILGSIQVKRGELDEAMQVFELALRDTPPGDDDDVESNRVPSTNLVARSVTYREMGGIHEKLGNEEDAVEMYHKSLECATQWRQTHRRRRSSSKSSKSEEDEEEDGPLCSLDKVQMSRTGPTGGNSNNIDEGEGMELSLGLSKTGNSGDKAITDFYNSFFPPYDDKKMKKKGKTDGSNDRMDLDVALTLHQIAQMYRRQGQHGRALDAYGAALQGMKHALGPYHPNVAAILGNMGNLQNEMGDFDAAYDTYQEVLGIESYRLGFSHPEVAVSIHNIATIEVARGNFDHALSLYGKVLALQKKLYGEEHPSVAITASCMGDVHAKLGDSYKAMRFYEESFKIKTAVYGRHHLEVARMLHKMGKTAFLQGDYNLADSYISRAFLLYRMNKLDEEHEWVVDAYRDGADVDAAIVMGGSAHFEC